MRPVSVLLPSGEKVEAHVIRFGPKNSRITFVKDRDVTELIPTSTIYEIMEPGTKPAPSDPYSEICRQIDELGHRMETALSDAGVVAAPHMSLKERADSLRGLHEGKLVVVEGECWDRQDAEAAGIIEASQSAQEQVAA